MSRECDWTDKSALDSIGSSGFSIRPEKGCGGKRGMQNLTGEGEGGYLKPFSTHHFSEGVG